VIDKKSTGFANYPKKRSH